MDGQRVERICQLMLAFDLPITAPESMGFEHFLKHMRRDKKVLAGKIRLVLPTGIGQADVFSDVSEDLLEQVICDL